MEKLEQLLEQFPESMVLRDYKSFVNQPERIQITSQEDINDYDPTTLTSYAGFRVRLPRPALNVKSLQLARASLPNAVTSFPDSECVFWYYALPTVASGSIFLNNAGVPGALAFTFDSLGNLYDPGNQPVPGQLYFDSGVLNANLASNFTYDIAAAATGSNTPMYSDTNVLTYWIVYTTRSLGTLLPNYLRYIRLVPSNAQPELLDNFTGGFNRIFEDYDDLITELQAACTDDLLEGQASNKIAGTFKFSANQVNFTFSQRFTKVVFTGLDQRFTYCPAAVDDPNLPLAAVELQERDRANQRFSFTGAVKVIQPFWPFRDMNLRLGFTYAIYPPADNFFNMLRPVPPYIASPPISIAPFTIYDHVAPGYPDLVYSACCHLYCDITGGSTVDSLVNKALLASLPMNTPTLGVGFHSLPLNNPLTKISDQLYEISIELRTDTGAPFYIGNNAIVSCEFILTY